MPRLESDPGESGGLRYSQSNAANIYDRTDGAGERFAKRCPNLVQGKAPNMGMVAPRHIRLQLIFSSGQLWLKFLGSKDTRPWPILAKVLSLLRLDPCEVRNDKGFCYGYDFPSPI